MRAPADGVLTLSRRATMADVQILHPFQDRTFHRPHLCTCCTLCSPGHFSSFQCGHVDSPAKKGFGAHLLGGRGDYPLSFWEHPALSPTGCVVPRPQFLPLSDGIVSPTFQGYYGE